MTLQSRIKTVLAYCVMAYLMLVIFQMVTILIGNEVQPTWVWSKDDEPCGKTCADYCHGACVPDRMTLTNPPVTRNFFEQYNADAVNSLACSSVQTCTTIRAEGDALAQCAFPIRESTTEICFFPADVATNSGDYCKWQAPNFKSLCLCWCKPDVLLRF
jgi:hypothetical protein